MNKQIVDTDGATAILGKSDPSSPCIIATGRESVAIGFDISFAGRDISKGTAIVLPSSGLVPGTDYGVIAGSAGALGMERLTELPTGELWLGGFHFAPGGNATARKGGDDIPAINPCSIYDRNFRFAGTDPRGMFFNPTPRGPGWIDVYPLCKDHIIHGTSKFGVTIADGNDPPQNPAGGYYRKLDFDVAVGVAAHHGKTLASVEELFAAAFGGTERTACGHDPKITGLDALRTSQRGMMQPFGTMLQWCHDGDPDTPRASFFGGSWVNGGSAGSRYASVGYNWPGHSGGLIGARCRGDHLQLG